VGLGIKKNDTAIVLSGKEKGKKGRVITVMPSKEKAIIENINIIKKHIKPNKQNTQGGIISKEGSLHISNIMLVCPKCSKPTRMSTTIFENGKKLRMCKKCKEVID